MSDILTKDNIILNAEIADMSEAILMSGGILLNNGYVEKEYIDDMMKKEEKWSSYIGYNIAIPHGFSHSMKLIKKSGVSVLQIPNGFQTKSGDIVHLVFGIAGVGDEHVSVLGKIALICSEEENIQKIIHAKNEDEIISLFDLDE